MQLSKKEILDLISELEDIEKERIRKEEMYKHKLQELKKRFNCSSLEEANSLKKKLEKKLPKDKNKLEKLFNDFKEEFSDVLGSI